MAFGRDHRAREGSARLRARLGAGLSLSALAAPALAADEAAFGVGMPMVGLIGLGALAIASIAWAIRVTAASRTASADWSQKLAEIEAQLEKSEAVLSAHPGLVLVWEDDYDAIREGWGAPKILGGPAALASLMAFANGEAIDKPPVDSLLDALGELPLEDDGPAEERGRLKEKVRDLRAHGVAFSGFVMTSEGRAIEADGRVAGGQVALWLTDPAARMAEDGGILGKIRERTSDLHGSLAQLERAPFPAWRRNADLTLSWVNQAYVETVEAANPAIVLKDQIELDASARKIAERAAAERRAIEGRIVINVGGQRRAFKATESPLHAAADAGVGGFAFDVTELEKAKGDLKNHIEANRRTLDQVPAAVALFGASQELVYHNAAFQRLWGLDEAELGARPSHGELLEKLWRGGKLPEQADFGAWKRAQLALYTDHVAAPGRERDGAAPDEVWRLADARMLRVARARHPLGGVVVVFDDITEKVQLEARYNTQIGVQRATLNNLAEGVAVFGADGRLRLYNAAFKRLWRLDEDALAERPHIETLLAQMTGRVIAGAEALASVKTRATSMTPEHRAPLREAALTLADGRTLAFGSEPLPDGATLAHFLDVTDSREREKELKERNAFLEDIDRQKSKFVDHVSYHLRTPLSTIIGFSEMLDGQMFGVLNERQKDYVAAVLTASHHLRDLITDIIDLAAIDAGKMTIDAEEVDVRDLLTNAATYAALKAEDTQVALKVDCPRDIGLMRADPRRMKQVLFNLLSNAFAYSSAGGEVTLGADRAPGLIRIFVADTGRGVSPADQARVFEPFESSGPSAGAGLGLALVQRFVALHGGWVRMESQAGAGTRVTCYLPSGSQPAQRPDTPPTPPAGGAPTPGARRDPAATKPPRVARRTPRAEAAE